MLFYQQGTEGRRNTRNIRLTLTFALILIVVSLSAQPKNLALEGAGIRGIAYAGAIRYLEETNSLKQIDKVAGTSAGAIAALAISLGYNSKEIEDLILKTKIQTFNDGKFFFIGGFSRMSRSYGWYQGKKFTRWLERVIEEKTGEGDITFKELHDRGFKDLYVTGTSLNNQRLLIFSHETYPQMKVKDAVRISISIPFYFEAIFIDSVGRVMNRKTLPENHDLVVDGGLIGNFPIFIFDSVYVENGVLKRMANKYTIGLRIDTPEQISYDSANRGLAPRQVLNLKSFVGSFYNYVIENLNRSTLTPEDWSRTVSISSGKIGPKIRKLSDAEKKELIQNGYEAMERFGLAN